MGDLCDNVIEALDVLNVDGGVDIDAVSHQLFDVEISLGMPAAVSIGVGKLVHQHDLRMPSDHRIEIHLLKMPPLIVNALARDDFKTFKEGFSLAPAMGLDHADDDIIAVLPARMRLLQHLISLAHAGRRPDKDAQLADAPLRAARRFEKRFRRRSMLATTALISHQPLGPP